MGTEIHLEVGGVSVSGAKNNPGPDYGCLFQEGDRTQLRTDEFDEPDADHIELVSDDEESHRNEALARTLARVLPRLDLLGHTIESARAEYDAILAEQREFADEDSLGTFDLMSFDEFCELACRYPLADLDETQIDFDHPDRDTISKGRFLAVADEIKRLPPAYDMELFWSEKSYFEAKFCRLSAYSMLQVFGLSEQNRSEQVTWDYGPLVEAGWASVSVFTPGTSRRQTVLVATEGSTDSSILRFALEALRPDVADFFRFVDVDEKHPFWGTGNLVKFAEGLVRIDIQNKVLFILDNDAEGLDALRRLERLSMPANMRAMLLPDDEAFCSFPAIGPEGTKNSDINGRAAAIECYLDLRLPTYPPAVVRWSNYKKDIDAWQGALEFKETYMRHFFEQTPETLRSGNYDISRLERLLDKIIEQATWLQQYRSE
ncbi:hypothetical protein DIE06_27625 [Burkholderia sp. Bp8998]|nr:hypothetical protein DIE06_27625 [Burkholderia sp. Bp8998]